MDSVEKPTIIMAAILLANKTVISLPKPNRHHNIIKVIIDNFGKEALKKHIQGFIDSNGTFLTRSEAYEVAFTSGQIAESNIKTLISEDLW